MVGMRMSRIHFFPQVMVSQGSSQQLMDSPGAPSKALVPCGPVKLDGQSSLKAAPHHPTLPNLCTDQSLTVWQGHPPAFGHAALPRSLCPLHRAPSTSWGVPISREGPRAQGSVLHLGRLHELQKHQQPIAEWAKSPQ